MKCRLLHIACLVQGISAKIQRRGDLESSASTSSLGYASDWPLPSSASPASPQLVLLSAMNPLLDAHKSWNTFQQRRSRFDGRCRTTWQENPTTTTFLRSAAIKSRDGSHLVRSHLVWSHPRIRQDAPSFRDADTVVLDRNRAITAVRGGAITESATATTAATANTNGVLSALLAMIQFIESSETRCWILLFAAILLETFGATLMKLGRDQNSLKILALALSVELTSVSGFAIALENIDVSVAYAVWAALGTAIVSAAGILLFNESYDAIKLCCLAMIIVGVVGLNLRDSH